MSHTQPGCAASTRAASANAIAATLLVFMSASSTQAACVDITRSGDEADEGMGRRAGEGGAVAGMSPQNVREGDGISVYGTINGFGSLCINGLRVVLPKGLPVLRDDEAVSTLELRVGHVMTVDAVQKNGELVAKFVALQPLLQGPVTARDPSGAGVEVMGVAIESHPEFSMADAGDLALEQNVLVYGLRQPDGSITASRIDERELDAPAKVWGVLDSSQEQLGVGGVEVSFDTSNAPAADLRVTFTGQWHASRARLERASWSDAQPLLGNQGAVSVEAVVVRSGSRLSFFVSNAFIEESELPGERRSVATGDRVWVGGERLPNGHIRVKQWKRVPPGLRKQETGIPPAKVTRTIERPERPEQPVKPPRP